MLVKDHTKLICLLSTNKQTKTLSLLFRSWSHMSFKHREQLLAAFTLVHAQNTYCIEVLKDLNVINCCEPPLCDDKCALRSKEQLFCSVCIGSTNAGLCLCDGVFQIAQYDQLMLPSLLKHTHTHTHRRERNLNHKTIHTHTRANGASFFCFGLPLPKLCSLPSPTHHPLKLPHTVGPKMHQSIIQFAPKLTLQGSVEPRELRALWFFFLCARAFLFSWSWKCRNRRYLNIFVCGDDR